MVGSQLDFQVNVASFEHRWRRASDSVQPVIGSINDLASERALNFASVLHVGAADGYESATLNGSLPRIDIEENRRFVIVKQNFIVRVLHTVEGELHARLMVVIARWRDTSGHSR